MKRSLSLVLALLATLALLGIPALSAASSSFETGVYTGKTSQGYKLSFNLSEIKTCGGPERLVLCLIQKGYGYVKAKCQGGGTEVDRFLYLVQEPLGSSGRLRGESTIAPIKYDLLVKHNGTMSGYFSFKGAENTNGAVTCQSGNVGFKLKRAS